MNKKETTQEPHRREGAGAMSSSPLARDFSMGQLLRYTLPSMLMMLLMSTYSIIDGVFVSALVGEDALAAVNLVMPIFAIVMAVGLMFATGSNAVIATLMGRGRTHEARGFMSAIYLIGGALGALMTLCIFLMPERILELLRVSEGLYSLSKDYLLSIAGFMVPVFFMVFIQSFMVTAGKPTLGLVLSVAGGLTNVVLDYLFISPDIFDMGIAGAGLATGIGNALPGVIGVFYFLFCKKGSLYFVKPKLQMRDFVQSLFNGSSELVGALAVSITTILFNVILLDMVGDSGVAAISVILYINMLQNALYSGYTLGVCPIISYKYGEGNSAGLRKTVRRSFSILAAASALVIGLTLLLSKPAVGIFISSESETFELARSGLLLFLPAYLFMGFNIFFSALFTALSNGRVSALLSAMRSLVFIVIALLVLPRMIGLNGVWLAVPVAEGLALLLSLYFYKKHRKSYHY